MDKTELLKLAVALYGQLASVSDYSIPDKMPEVHAFPKSIVQDLVCGHPCHIRAFYHPDFGLVADDALGDTPYDRSIILHELVHHAQHITGRFDKLHGCEMRAASEKEAFVIQNRYLMHHGADPIPIFGFDHMCESR